MPDIIVDDATLADLTLMRTKRGRPFSPEMYTVMHELITRGTMAPDSNHGLRLHCEPEPTHGFCTQLYAACRRWPGTTIRRRGHIIDILPPLNGGA